MAQISNIFSIPTTEINDNKRQQVSLNVNKQH